MRPVDMDRPPDRLRAALRRGIVPCVGIYDAFSASIATRHFEALFVSGFGFAASHYGMPDIGFVAWPDILEFVRRLRAALPAATLLVDIDDGFCDVDVACHVVRELEALGAAGVVLEDQRRPRRCGHVEGKQILPLPEYVAKLERVLAARRDLFVVARTDASDADDVVARARAFEAAGADAVLADGIRDLGLVSRLRTALNGLLAFNQIAGGRSPACSLAELAALGVRLAIYSTPALFAAAAAVDAALRDLRADGRLPTGGPVTIAECNELLYANLERRPAGRGRD
jgi:2-methylisocitrate lyase-like PEP mutase family enzyme